MRNESLMRVLRLANLLRAGRPTLDQLASLLGVSTRTIRRDLVTLTETGFVIQSTGSEYGERVWHIGHDGICPFCQR